jgi:hypothetical protein
VLSILPYPTRFYPEREHLAMRIGGEYRIGHVRRRHWARLADACGLDPERVLEAVRQVVEELPAAVEAASSSGRELGFDRDFVSRFRDSTLRNADSCRRQVAGAGSA